MTKIHNVPKTLDNECVNVRRAAIEQRGKWAGAFYMEAKRQGIDLEPIMRKAIYNIGLEAGKEERKKFGDDLHAADYGRCFCTKKYHETFEKAIINDQPDEFDCSLNYCPLVAAWQKMGLDDETCHLLCDIAMEGDRGIAEGLGLDFDLLSVKSAGAECCHLKYKTRK